MNLLSIGAAYGVVVALFQWGWLSDVTGVQPAPIEPWAPTMLFAIVFGLSPGLGDKNWWLPGWLERLLPKVEVERQAEQGIDGTDVERALVK